MGDQLLLEAVLPDHLKRVWLCAEVDLIRAFLALFNQFVDDSLGDLYEFEGFHRLLNAQQQEPSQRVHRHDVVQIALNGLIEFADDGLRGIDGFEARFELAPLGMQEG